MSHSLYFPFALSLLALPATGFARDYDCHDLNGTVVIDFTNDCKILNKKHKFPSVDFLAEDPEQSNLTNCVSGSFSGTLRNSDSDEVTEVYGISESGVTENNYGGIFQTAATWLKIFEDGSDEKLGNVYTMDTFTFDDSGDSFENLVVTDGTKIFKGSKGSLAINGNSFIGAPFSGTICLED